MKDPIGRRESSVIIKKTVLVNRLLHSERIGLGKTADHSLKQPWDGEKEIAGPNSFRAFMKRNKNLILIIPEHFFVHELRD